MCWISRCLEQMTMVERPTLTWRYATIPIPVSFRHRTRAEVLRGLWLDAEQRPSFKSEKGGREKYRERNTLFIHRYQAHALQSVFRHRQTFEKSTRLPYYRGRFFVVLFPLFATLADPAADVADRELRNSNQPSKVGYPSSPGSMIPLPASSARMALRQTPHVSSARLSQVQRHFSTTSPVRKEIQDAYILSAARTPTGKVRRTS